jgi:hypothetical protein
VPSLHWQLALAIKVKPEVQPVQFNDDEQVLQPTGQVLQRLFSRYFPVAHDVQFVATLRQFTQLGSQATHPVPLK